MKYLKLLLLFVGVIGGIILAFNIPNWIKGDGSNPDPLPPVLVKYQTELEEGWNERSDWDKDFFEKQYFRFNNLRGEYKPSDVNTLLDYNRTKAIDKIYPKIFEQWHMELCDHNIVKQYKDAIKMMCKIDIAASSNSRIQEINVIHGVYTTALHLATKTFNAKTNFNGSGWQTYEQFTAGITNQINSILRNQSYLTHLANIRGIKNGLASYQRRICDRGTYYSTLANQICAQYNKILSAQRTISHLESLGRLYERYVTEYGGSIAIENLIGKYDDDIARNNQAE